MAEVFDFGDFIILEGQKFQILQVVKTLDLDDGVELEEDALDLCEGFKIFYLCDSLRFEMQCSEIQHFFNIRCL